LFDSIHLIWMYQHTVLEPTHGLKDFIFIFTFSINNNQYNYNG